jgi:hypothetical protein
MPPLHFWQVLEFEQSRQFSILK